MEQLDYASRATRYALAVATGSISASKWVRLQCQIHLDDLEKSERWVFDAAWANFACEMGSKYKHEKGVKQGERIVFEDAQIFIIASIFGWVDRETGVRKYREAFILMPRGSGKSPLAAIIGVIMAFFAGEPGAEVYCGANSMRQAMEVFRPAKSMIDQEPKFRERFGIETSARSIYQLKTRSRFIPLCKKPGDGASVWCAILDEYHEALNADLYDTYKTGATKRPGSLIFVISTAGIGGTDNSCYALQQEAQTVLEGTLPNERWFVLIHCADESVEWTTPEALQMAQPMLGISNDREAIELDIQAAIRNPAKANIVKAKFLNIWAGGSGNWMNMVFWRACFDQELKDKGEDLVKHLPCWIGSDLASKLDLSACIRLYRDDTQGLKPHYYALTRVYLPEERVNESQNQHYQNWAKNGFLTATRGSSIDYSVLEADAVGDVLRNDVRQLAYDARYADQWSQRVEEISGVTRVEMPPSPAILSPAMKELEAAVYDGRFHHDGHPVLAWCVSNVVTSESGAGNYRMPDKRKPESKIDAAIALILAQYPAMLAEVPKRSVYATRGLRTL